jgi:hypothetical protein
VKFPTLLADAIIIGLLESEITLKVYGVDAERPIYMLESADPSHPVGMVSGDESDLLNPAPPRTYERMRFEIRRAMLRTFRLGIDLIPYEDAFPDPSPLNAFFIHRTTRHILDLRNNPDYDPDVIAGITGSAVESAAELEKQRRSGNYSISQARDPNQVDVLEYWGDIHDPTTGELLERNTLCTIANGQMLREPVHNPFWHGYRPIVRAALQRTPLSPTHDAMIDRAIPVAKAENEIASLMVDGGTAAVWGVRQIRLDYLQNASAVTKGGIRSPRAASPPGSPGCSRRRPLPGRSSWSASMRARRCRSTGSRC